MQKAKLGIQFDLKALLVWLAITVLIVMLLPPDVALATVESSIKGVGASFQKLALGCGVIGFTLGGLGMMFGAQWGMRTIVGSMLGTACILGGNSMVSFFSSQIR
jgi:hypothetical protein